MPSRILLDVDKIMENMRQIAIDYPDHFTSFWPTDLIYIVDTLVQRERALHDWQPIAAAQKNTPYLIAYRNAYGKDRVIKAVYIERYTVESNLDAECDDEYDEGTCQLPADAAVAVATSVHQSSMGLARPTRSSQLHRTRYLTMQSTSSRHTTP